MTVVMPQTRVPDAQPAAARAVPRPVAGLEFFGEYQGSGYAEPRYLVRRADGQVVQISLLLDLVLRQIDSTRDLCAVAAAVTETFGRQVQPDDVAYLIDHKLRPAGLIAPEDGAETAAPRTDLLLALRGHATLLGRRQVLAASRALAWLHRPPIVAAVLLAAIGFDLWLFGVHGAAGPLAAVIRQPQLLLTVLGLGIASMFFHELGHASACRYSGARPGRIGCGVYLIWPSLYTDVTDAYRLGRAGRLRTDLGGVYFNTIFILAMAGCYAGTGRPSSWPRRCSATSRSSTSCCRCCVSTATSSSPTWPGCRTCSAGSAPRCAVCFRGTAPQASPATCGAARGRR